MKRACVFHSEALFRALPALVLLAYLVMTEPPAVLLLFLGALATHEWGHLVAFRLVGAQDPAFSIAGVGARLSPSLPLLPKDELWVALAGPLSNILFALLALRFGRGDFFLLLAAVHLLFGVCNLLPFGLTDGERVMRLLLARSFPRFSERLTRVIGAIFLAFLFYFSLFLYYLTGNGLAGIFFSLFFLLGHKNSFSDVF